MSAIVSVTGSGCCRGRGAGWNATRRCVTRWRGRMTCSTTTNGPCCNAVRCSPAGSTWPPPPPVCERLDEYAVLDVLDSLVRKSLITVEQVGRHARYGMLETIRQFAEERLAATDTIDQVRDRHAAYYAEQAVAHWDLWEGPGYRARGRLGRRRVRQPARRVPLGRRPRRPGHRDGDRRPHHHAGVRPAAVRADGLGRRDPPRRHRRRSPAAPPPLHRRWPVLLMSDGSTPPPPTPTRRWRCRTIPATTRSTRAGAECVAAAADFLNGGDLDALRRRSAPTSPTSPASPT